MTSREVYKDIESKIAPYYPDYLDTPALRCIIKECVNTVETNLDLPQHLCVKYVKNVFASYRPKIED